MTWVLIVVFMGGYGVATSTIGGYQSAAGCQAAAATLDERSLNIETHCVPKYDN